MVWIDVGFADWISELGGVEWFGFVYALGGNLHLCVDWIGLVYGEQTNGFG